jgi:hypothetical protein
MFVFFTGCTQKKETRWDTAQQDSAKNVPATSDNALDGSAFNVFFPKSADGFDLVFTQEKKGFAEAKLKKDGKDMALLSIFDTVSNPEAAAKFATSTETLAGFPVMDNGSQGTVILVAERFQVQVRSQDDAFSQFDREDWLQQFDLDGLSALK